MQAAKPPPLWSDIIKNGRIAGALITTIPTVYEAVYYFTTRTYGIQGTDKRQ